MSLWVVLDFGSWKSRGISREYSHSRLELFGFAGICDHKLLNVDVAPFSGVLVSGTVLEVPEHAQPSPFCLLFFVNTAD